MKSLVIVLFALSGIGLDAFADDSLRLTCNLTFDERGYTVADFTGRQIWSTETHANLIKDVSEIEKIDFFVDRETGFRKCVVMFDSERRFCRVRPEIDWAVGAPVHRPIVAFTGDYLFDLVGSDGRVMLRNLTKVSPVG